MVVRMTSIERTLLEKSDKRASESKAQQQRVSQEVYERRRRFFKAATEDHELIDFATLFINKLTNKEISK